MPPPGKGERDRRFLLLILVNIVATSLALVGNVATSALPAGWKDCLWIAWPLLATLVVVSVGLAVWQFKADQKRSLEPPSVPSAAVPWGGSQEEARRRAWDAQGARTALARPRARAWSWTEFREVIASRHQSYPLRAEARYRASEYLPRSEAQAAFEQFIQSDRRCLVITGGWGMGKSQFLLWLCSEWPKANTNGCAILCDGGLLDAGQALGDRLGQELDEQLHRRHPLDLWSEINRIEGIHTRKVVLCIDALDENGEPAALLDRVDDLARVQSWPWLKLVVTCGSRSWDSIRYWASDPSANRTLYELGPFGEAETHDAYEKCRAKDTLPHYERLAPAEREALCNPWLLGWVAEMQELPASLSMRVLAPRYMEHLRRTGTIGEADIAWLKDVLLPAMLSSPAAFSEVPVPENQYEICRRLAKADFITLLSRGRGEACRRGGPLWDYFAGQRLFEQGMQGNSLPSLCLKGVHDLGRHPHLWGALLNAVMLTLDCAREGDAAGVEALSQLCDEGDRDGRDLVVTALDEYAREGPGHRRYVESLVRSLYHAGTRQRLGVARKTRQKVAVLTAAKLRLVEILREAATDRSSFVRGRAVTGIYQLWRADPNAGFTILASMVSPLYRPWLLLRAVWRLRPTVSAVQVSLLILLREYKQPRALTGLARLWVPVIRRALPYSPASKPGRRMRRLFRGITLLVVLSAAALIQKAIPNRYKVVNVPELRRFYRLSPDIRERARLLVDFLNPDYGDMDDLREILSNLFHSDANNVMLMLIIDYALVAQGKRDFERAWALAQWLADEELSRPGDHRVMWSRCWACAALAYKQPSMNRALFEKYGSLIDRTAGAGKWCSSVREYAAIGRADYVYISALHGFNEVGVLRRVLGQARDRGDHQTIRDVLEEVGIVAYSHNSLLALPVLGPVLTVRPLPAGKRRHILRKRAQGSAQDIRKKVVDILAVVRSIAPHETDAFLEREIRTASGDDVAALEELRALVYVKKVEERMVADMLKGGLGPWVRFVLDLGLEKWNHLLISTFTSAVESRSFLRFAHSLTNSVIDLVSKEAAKASGTAKEEALPCD